MWLPRPLIICGPPPVENQPPVAVAGADVTSGKAPLVVSFDSSASIDPDMEPLLVMNGILWMEISVLKQVHLMNLLFLANIW